KSRLAGRRKSPQRAAVGSTPSARQSVAVATSDPTAAASTLAWVTITGLRADRIAARSTRARSAMSSNDSCAMVRVTSRPRSCAGLSGFFFVFDLREDARDILGVFHRAVENEAQPRNRAQRQARRQLSADESAGVLQRLHRLLLLLLAAVHAHVDPREAHVGRDVNPQDADEAEAGILHLALKDPAQLFSQDRTDLLAASCAH